KMKLIGTLFIIILSASLSYAGIYTTNPFSTTVWNGGDAVTITFNEDNKPPLINTLHNVTCDLFAGTSQVFVANIAKGVDCATTQSVPYTVPKTVGPEATCYFIKYTDSSNSSNVFYSALFTIKGISGSNFDPASVCNANSTTANSAPASATPTSSSPATNAVGNAVATQPPTVPPASKPTSPANSAPASKANSSPTASGTLKAPTPASASSGDFNHPISNFAGLSLAIIAVALT
ncbi:14066_t:CDS:2, partial [Racocetra persica]